MTDKKPENLKRRGFLLAAGVGSAGAVAAGGAGVGKEKTPPVGGRQPGRKGGRYGRTPHVSNYYRTARV